MVTKRSSQEAHTGCDTIDCLAETIFRGENKKQLDEMDRSENWWKPKKVGQMSGVVDTDSGSHLILRLE